jgi:hypothetical protein
MVTGQGYRAVLTHPVAAALVGRSRLPERLRAQLGYLAACGLAFAATGLMLGRHPAFLLAGNFAVGLGSGWLVVRLPCRQAATGASARAKPQL